MSATLIFDSHDSWVGDAKIYHLEPPYEGHECVAITVHPVSDGAWQNAGVEVVGCDENGIVPGDYVVAVYSSYEVISHTEVLERLGYPEVS